MKGAGCQRGNGGGRLGGGDADAWGRCDEGWPVPILARRGQRRRSDWGRRGAPFQRGQHKTCQGSKERTASCVRSMRPEPSQRKRSVLRLLVVRVVEEVVRAVRDLARRCGFREFDLPCKRPQPRRPTSPRLGRMTPKTREVDRRDALTLPRPGRRRAPRARRGVGDERGDASVERRHVLGQAGTFAPAGELDRRLPVHDFRTSTEPARDGQTRPLWHD